MQERRRVTRLLVVIHGRRPRARRGWSPGRTSATSCCRQCLSWERTCSGLHQVSHRITPLWCHPTRWTAPLAATAQRRLSGGRRVSFPRLSRRSSAS